MINPTPFINKQQHKDNYDVDKLLEYLFADKKAIYIDDINFSADGGYDVSWCLEFTLKMTNPQWMDTHLERPVLIAFIRAEKLNHWETFQYDQATGSVQPHTNIMDDLETFLDENYEDVIKEYMKTIAS